MVVPMVGQGTAEDPRRPAFVPAPPRPGDAVAERTDLAGILGFTAIVSDDGRFALVEFVAEDPEAFRAIRTDARVVKAFEVGKARREDIETEFRKHRKDFELDRMGVSLP
ncbi:MAG: hypothetical protein IPM24_28390 [Bryobacterales bacterium]|nr:hypothetical protein [Bryobacterales bacterium]